MRNRIKCIALVLCFGVAVAGCFDGPSMGHPCNECLPCEECAYGPDGPRCDAESHHAVRCGGDGHVYWVDSCDNEEDLISECPAGQGVCVEPSDTEAECECLEHWEGDDCSACPGNWDPQQNCAACTNHWVDDDDDCGTCPPHWDPDEDCNQCLNHWVDIDDDCGTCPGNWDAEAACNDCLGHWDPAWDCVVCEDNWLDNDDDCGSCVPNWDVAEDCEECLGNWVDFDDDCDTCPIGWTGLDCDTVDDTVACPVNSGWPCVCIAGVSECDDGSHCSTLGSMPDTYYGLCAEECTDDDTCSETVYDADEDCGIVDDIDDPTQWWCLLRNCVTNDDCPDGMTCQEGASTPICYPAE